jgi:hypothetical protein
VNDETIKYFNAGHPLGIIGTHPAHESGLYTFLPTHRNPWIRTADLHVTYEEASTASIALFMGDKTDRISRHQPPDWSYMHGHSIIADNLYLGGEDDVDQLLYGMEVARTLNGKGILVGEPNPSVDIWIDLRDIRDNNRRVFVPDGVEHIPLPFRDGVYAEAESMLPIAKSVLEKGLAEGKRVLVTCHQGRSRSFILLLWHLSEKFGSYQNAYWHIKNRRSIVEPDRAFKPFLEEWGRKYKK